MHGLRGAPRRTQLHETPVVEEISNPARAGGSAGRSARHQQQGGEGAEGARVQRKIMGTFRNGKSTGIYETMMTVLASWKQQGRDLSQTLGETLTQEWTKS